MIFTDPGFLFFFLPLFLLIFFLAHRLAGPRGSLVALIAISLLMAGLSSPWFLVLMSVSAAVNYAALSFLIRRPAKDPRGLVLAVTIGANLLLLAFFKYAVWLEWIPVIGTAAMSLATLMPVTWSFLTFQRSVALLDAYQNPALVASQLSKSWDGRSSRADPPLRFAGFATAFPNLLIGPIAYITEILPQLARPDFGRFRRVDFSVGLTLLIVGIFKKVVLADMIADDLVDKVFDRALTAPVSPFDAAMALLGYFAQLYFDFSGYSDMAIGIARMMGIRLPANFNSPLRATGIIDFYRRWHITLTRVIARFLYSPLSIAGTRWSVRRRIPGPVGRLVSTWAPLLANFLVIGLWHGPQITYLLFGLIHGLWYIAETEVRRTRAWKDFRKRTRDVVRLWLGWMITVPPLVLTFGLFRSENVEHLMNMTIYSITSPAQRMGLFLPALELVAAFAIVWLLPNTNEWLARYRPAIITYPVPSTTPLIARFRWRPTLAWGLFVGLLGLVVIVKVATPRQFVYGGF